MEKEVIIRIIDDKIKKIEEAQIKNTLIGSLNFGVHVNDYVHSAHLQTVLKKRKKLIIFLWLETFSIALMMIIILAGIFEKFENNLWKAIVAIIMLSLLTGLIFIYFPLRHLIAETNSVQAEVKKMILEDIKEIVLSNEE